MGRPLDTFIDENAPGAILVTPRMYDCLRSQGFLRQVGTSEPGTGRGTTFGYDLGEHVRCWLIEPDIIGVLPPSYYHVELPAPAPRDATHVVLAAEVYARIIAGAG